MLCAEFIISPSYIFDMLQSVPSCFMISILLPLVQNELIIELYNQISLKVSLDFLNKIWTLSHLGGRYNTVSALLSLCERFLLYEFVKLSV